MSKKTKAETKSRNTHASSTSRALLPIRQLPAPLAIVPGDKPSTALLLSTALALALAFAADPGHAQDTLTWTGESPDNGNWSQPDNWAAPLLLTPGDNVVIAGPLSSLGHTTSIVDSAISIHDLTVSGTDIRLNVNENLTVTGDTSITDSATVEIAAEKSLTATAPGSTFTVGGDASLGITGTLDTDSVAADQGQINLRGGTITGSVEVLTVGAINAASGNSSIGGDLNLSTATSRLDLSGGNLTVTGALESAGIINIGGGQTLTGSITASNTSSTQISGSLTGALSTSGSGARIELIDGAQIGGTTNVSGTMTSNGNTTVTGTLTVDAPSGGVGGGRLDVETGNLTATAGVINGNVATIADGATVTGNMRSTEDAQTTIDGTLTGALTTEQYSTTTLTGTLGSASISGEMQGEGTITGALDITTTGAVTVTGALQTASVNNAGGLNVGTDSTLTGALTLQGNSNTTITGAVNGNIIANEFSATTMTGTVTGNVEMSGTMDLEGEITQDLTITSTGAVSLTGDVTVGKVINNRNFSVEAGRELTGDIETTATGHTNIAGIVDGNVEGVAGSNTTLTGEITGNATMAGTLLAQGTIGGTLDIRDGATVTLTGTLAADRIINGSTFDVVSGNTVTADIETTATGRTNIAGIVDGNVEGLASSNTTLTGEVTGNTTMAGTLLAQGTIGGTLDIRDGATVTLTGALSATRIINGSLLNVDQIVTADIQTTGTGRTNISERVNGNVEGLTGSNTTLTGEITGNVVMNGTMLAQNEIGGALTIQSNGRVTTTGNLSVAGTGVTSSGDLVVAAGHTLNAPVELLNGGDATIAGAVTGNVISRQGSTLDLDNLITGNLQADGTVAAQGQVTGTFTIGDTGNVTTTADLLTTGITSSGNLNVTVGTRLTGAVTANATSDTTIAGQVIGNVTGAANSDTTLTGTITGDLDMAGTMLAQGAVTGLFEIDTTGTVTTTGNLTTPAINNAGRLNVATGTTAAEITTFADANTTIAGAVIGNVTGEDDSDTTLTGTITGNVDMQGDMRARGQIDGAFTIASTGAVTTSGDLLTNGVSTSGDLNIATGLFTGAIDAANGAHTTITGEVLGNVLAREGSTTTLTGTIDGTLDMAGLMSAAGEVTGAFTIGDTGNVTTTGNLVTVGITNGGRLNVATGTLTGNVTTLATGNATIASTVDGTVIGRAGSNTVLTGTVTGPVTMEGTMTARGAINGLLTIANTGTVTTTGNLASTAVNNSGHLNVVAGHTLNGTVTTETSGMTTIAGTVTGGVTGAVNSDTVLTGRINGAVLMAGRMQAEGTINGALGVQATGVVNTTGNLSAHSVNNGGILTVGVGHRLTAPLTTAADGHTTIAGEVVGAVTGNATSETVLTGRIDGTVTMDGTMQARGEITGPLNIGATGVVTTTGALQSGTISNAGDLDVALGSTVTATLNTLANGDTTIAGDVIGAVSVAGSGELLLSGHITGNVSNLGELSFIDGARITGDLLNSGSLFGMVTGAADAAITISGDFDNSGPIDRIGGGTGSVIIYADNIVMRDTSPVPPAYVVLRGGITNYTDLVYGDGDALWGTFNNMPGGTLTIVGNVAGNDRNINNNGTLTVTATGTLADVNRIDNHDTADFAAGSTVDVVQVINHSGGTLSAAGVITGALSNAGDATISGVVGGNVINTNTLSLSGTINGNLVNNGDLTGTAAGRVDGNVTNDGRLTLAGSVGGTVDNLATGDATINGDIGGAVTNAGGIALFGTVASVTNSGTALVGGAVAGNLDNTGTGILNLRGTVGGTLTNSAGGAVAITGNSSAGAVINDGTLTINAGQTLATNSVNSSGALVVAGELQGDVNATGLVRLTSGRIIGLVDSRGRLEVNGASEISGLTRIWAGDLVVAGGASLTTTQLNIANGATATNSGTLETNVISRGTYIQTGQLTGSLETHNVATVSGPISGNLSYLGGALNFTTLTVGGTFLTTQDLTLGTGQSATAGAFSIGAGSTTRVTDDATLTAAGGITNAGTLELSNRGIVTGNVSGGGEAALSIASRLNGNFTGASLSLASGSLVTGNVAASQLTLSGNSTIAGGVTGGTITATDLNTIGGTVTNASAISLASSSFAGTGDRLALGGLVGNGTTLTFDTDLGDSAILGPLHRDLITVDGAVTGSFNIVLNDNTDSTPVEREVGDVVLLRSTGSIAGMNVSGLSGLNDTSLRYSHSLVRDTTTNELVVRTELDSAIAVIAGSVSLSQSLIGALVNRPTSPYTVSRAIAEPDRNCAPGGWARATGGRANLNGKINSDHSGIATDYSGEIDVNYYGMQFGGDLSCFNGAIAGWDMAFGVLGGLNHGSGQQGAIGLSADVIATTSTTRTENEFDQTFLGLYATASRGRMIADLQIRGEKTDFKLKNPGIGLNDADLEVKAATISGAITTSFPLGEAENGWNLLPTAGFMVSKAKSSDLKFSSGDLLSIKDHTTKLAFAGAAISKLKIAESGDAATAYFATGTYYHDFSKNMESTYFIEGVPAPTNLTSEVLGSYGEVSLGMNYLKVLEKGPMGLPAKQFNAAVRVDGRFSDKLNSYAITGQVRWQF